MKKILRPVAFTLVAILSIKLIYNVLSIKNTDGGESDYYSVTSQLYATEKNLIDVVFVGSSHCYNSVYPSVLWNEYDIASFDMAISAQTRENSYYSLKEVLKTQNPRLVFVEMYGLIGEDFGNEGNRYRNYLSLKTSPNSVKLIREDNKEDFWNLFLRWPIVHTRYKEVSKYDFIKKPYDTYGRGAEMRMGQTGGFINYDVAFMTEATPISDENKAWIDKLYELSKKENFELVFIMAPYSVFEDEKLISNGAREYAQSLGIAYLDMNEMTEEIGYDPATDMMNDFHHSNMYGATKISRYLGQYIRDNYDIPSHKGEDKYYQWDVDYLFYKQLLFEEKLLSLSSEEEYFSLLSQCENMTVVLSLDGEYEHALQYLEYFGIDPSEAVNGGKWIYKNMTPRKIMDNNLGESHIVDLGKYDSVRVSYGENVAENVLFENIPCCLTENGLNVLIYDNIQKKVFDVNAY